MAEFAALATDELEAMAEAGSRVLECHRVLAKSGDNVVGEMLRDGGTFYELNHYPDGDVYDHESHAQHYYHAHRKGEHGHFHAFLREAGMAAGVRPAPQSEADYMVEREDKLSHLIAISMDAQGLPIALFTTNRWVTAENWYAAADVCAMLDRFRIDLARPSWPANVWITNMVRLFRPQIVDIVRERDTAIEAWRQSHPDGDVFEDRDLDIVSELAISIDAQMAAVEAARAARR